MPKTAQDYVEQFRGGVDFDRGDDLAHLMAGGRIDQATLSTLSRELVQGTGAVRENVVRLLEEIGLALDRPGNGKFRIIRDHGIIRALLVEGFAKHDDARNKAGTILLERCTPSDLAAFNGLYVKSLARLEGEYVDLAAKAKTTQARPYIDRIAAMPAIRENSDMREIYRIAQAALGNTAIEDEYINATRLAHKNAPLAPKNRFYDEGPVLDGTEIAARLAPLGMIGTRRSLRVACSYLRSPLKSYVETVSETTIRFAALDAIRYNFPDERILFEPDSLAGWATAERFCARRLGALFVGPTPDIPRHQIFPTGIVPLN